MALFTATFHWIADDAGRVLAVAVFSDQPAATGAIWMEPGIWTPFTKKTSVALVMSPGWVLGGREERSN